MRTLLRVPSRPSSSDLARSLLRKTDGQDLIEYGVLLGIIAAVVIVSLAVIQGRVDGMYGSLGVAIGASAGGSNPGGGNPGGGNAGGGNPGGGNPGGGNPGGANPGGSNPGGGNPGGGNPGNGKK